MPLSPSHHFSLQSGSEQRFLGIDPGTETLGWGVIRSERQRLTLLAASEIRLGRSMSLPQRLALLAEQLEQMVMQYRPTGAGIETIFAGKNRQSPILLAHARGVALMVLGKHAIPVAEYAPSQVKLAVTGHGQADKPQVQQMVGMLLGISKQQSRLGTLDRSDALAIAICHSQHGQGSLARFAGRL